MYGHVDGLSTGVCKQFGYADEEEYEYGTLTPEEAQVEAGYRVERPAAPGSGRWARQRHSGGS